jgi:D-glycero-alpha-D-manno-heptose 1-phosphate guanylyltransferase
MASSCIVLAGGLGTRLRSVVPNLPKCLAPVEGRPFLEWQLRSLAARGISHFILALGYGAYQVKEILNDSWTENLKIDYVEEQEALGTGGATQFAMIKSGISEALVVNGDTFLGGDLSLMLRPLDLVGGELMRMAIVEVDDRSRFGGVAVNHNNRVVAFLEKGEAGPGKINAGLYRVRLDAFQTEASLTFSMETSVMPRMIKLGALRASLTAGPFIDIGVPEDYKIFSKLYESYVQKI